MPKTNEQVLESERYLEYKLKQYISRLEYEASNGYVNAERASVSRKIAKELRELIDK